MHMSSLTEQFPQKVEVCGEELLVCTDFRTVLKCYEIQGNQQELSKEELLEMLILFYMDSYIFEEEHVEKMFWFFGCGREKEKKKFPRKIAGVNDKQPFDFKKDADLIYAGFMQQYGIDLQTADLHWWKFMILLENLGRDTRLSKVMEYRTIDVASKHLSKTEREFYKAMQRYYGLDRMIEMSDRMKRLEEALLNGGDVSKILAEKETEKGR